MGTLQGAAESPATETCQRTLLARADSVSVTVAQAPGGAPPPAAKHQRCTMVMTPPGACDTATAPDRVAPAPSVVLAFEDQGAAPRGASDVMRPEAASTHAARLPSALEMQSGDAASV